MMIFYRVIDIGFFQEISPLLTGTDTWPYLTSNETHFFLSLTLYTVSLLTELFYDEFELLLLQIGMSVKNQNITANRVVLIITKTSLFKYTEIFTTKK